MDRLLPTPASRPQRWWLVLLALVGTAWALLLPSAALPGSIPGDPALPYGPVTANLHWQLHTRGLAGLMADDLHGFPLRTDRIVTDGFPLDALASWPFTAALGHAVGLWAWSLAVLWALGAGAAWLGMRWWGTLGAGLVAGVGYQVGEAMLREVAEGRPSQAFSAIFLPFALGWGVEAARSGRTLPAVGAGVAAALGTLASWGLGPIFALAAFGPALGVVSWRIILGILGRGARPPATPPDLSSSSEVAVAAGTPWRALLVTLAAFVVPLAPVVAWVVAGRGELPSFAMDPWRETVLGLRKVRPVDLAAARIHGLGGVAFGTLARPVLVAAAAWTVLRAPPSRWAAPLAIAALAAILGLGSWLPGPVVLPWGWLQELPGFSRAWWPDRNWILVSLALALLAAGVSSTARLRGVGVVVAALVFAEAWATSRALPFGRLPSGPSPTAEVLARVPDVPLVLLPTGEGPFRPDRLDLLDQIRHGRPLANGTRPVLDLTSSDAVLRGWRNNAGLRALLACEIRGQRDTADMAGATAALVHAGLREVYLDPRYVDADPAYVTCVEEVLTGWERIGDSPLVRFRAPVE